MRLLRSIADATGAAAISLGMFGSMALLLGFRPVFDTTLTDLGADGPDEIVYAADVEEAIALIDALENPAPIPEPVVEPEPAPEPEAQPAAPDPEPVAAEPVEVAQAPAVDGPTRRDGMTREERLQAARERAQQRKRKRSCLEETDSVAELGPNRYRVERDLIDYYSSHLKEAAKLAYVHWYREDGEIKGFRVRRIRCGNVLHQAGFRNGDVILSINGRSVTTIPQALLAYRKLRRKKQLRVEVIRRDGAAVKLHYKLT